MEMEINPGQEITQNNRPEYFMKTIVSRYVSVHCWQNDGTEK